MELDHPQKYICEYKKDIDSKNSAMSMSAQVLCQTLAISVFNGIACFKNVMNCLNTNIYSCLETSDYQSPNLYLNVVHFINTSVNYTSVAAEDCCFLSLVSNTCCSINSLQWQKYFWSKAFDRVKNLTSLSPTVRYTVQFISR